MNTLLVKRHDRSRNELTAELNGVELPLIANIQVVSNYGEMPKLIIEFVIHKTINGQVIVDINNDYKS